MRRVRRLAGSVLRRIVRIAVRPTPVRRIVEGALRDAAPRPSAAKPAARPTTAARSTLPRETFVDRHGTAHQLDPELRDRLKPGWRTMLDGEALATPPTDAAVRERARKAATTIAEARALISVTTGRTLTGRILEIGCYDGSAAFAMAADSGATVIGSDLARYYVDQRPGHVPSANDIERQQGVLADLRERARIIAGIEPGRVAFVEDDITQSTLEPGTFDVIVSFEVLEHVLDPSAGFAAMAALLKPGGVMYHDYNPFFASNGGHSLVTLDFPWGHARLDDGDVERYVREIRPAEVEQDLRFYRESLNRMTRADLAAAIDGAGLDSIAIVPWTQRSLIPQLTPTILEEVRRIYPGVRPEELVQTFVSVVARKPGVSGPAER
jgi:2-polyprenyl-3-methyl-5-hydroxy-6-metoxy-1,4-benzoquinol methylase